MNTKVNEGKLISGKEALIALANGEEVETCLGGEWLNSDHVKALPVERIIENYYNFRLKPRTITINGIEVPAPFEPKEDEDCRCYYINTALKHGFDWYHPTHHESNRVAWRTEEEIRQVIAALRIAFKPQ